ncbi:MAG: DUF4214 domain-containing protein [Acidimicrobiales bacterium]|nr:DUF4214 domain-containing protein [Acidimicrobiales bacterium]
MRRLTLILVVVLAAVAGLALPVGAATAPVDSLASLRMRVTPRFVGSAANNSFADLSGNGRFVLYDRPGGRVGLFDVGMNNTILLGDVDAVPFGVSDRGETVVYSSGGLPLRWSRATGQSVALPSNGGRITDMALSQSGAVVVYTEQVSGTSGIMRIWTATRVRSFSATVTPALGPEAHDVFVIPNGQAAFFRSGESIRQVAVSSGVASFSPLTQLAGLSADASVQALAATDPVRFSIATTDGSTPTEVGYPQPSQASAAPVVLAGNATSVLFNSNDELYRWRTSGELTYLQASGASPLGRPRDASLSGAALLTSRGTGDTILELMDLNGPEIRIIDRRSLEGPQLSDQIRRLYFAYLDREPDSRGLSYWTTFRAGGTSLSAISAQFAASTEFENTYGVLSDGGFVDLVYANVLGRPPDASGRAFWLGQLQSGMTRGSLMIGFSESQEFLNRTETAAPGPSLGHQIERLYRAYFNRSADQGGLDFWLEQIANGANLGALSGEFARSAEFVGTYGNLDNGQFVDLVYQNVLGRVPDVKGRAFWLETLETGVLTRGQVMIGFSESVEFILATDTMPP